LSQHVLKFVMVRNRVSRTRGLRFALVHTCIHTLGVTNSYRCHELTSVRSTLVYMHLIALCAAFYIVCLFGRTLWCSPCSIKHADTFLLCADDRFAFFTCAAKEGGPLQKSGVCNTPLHQHTTCCNTLQHTTTRCN